jgi:quercetin dioxygenase-like cupin family protein
MRLLAFDTSVGRHVDRYGSDFVLSPLATLGGSGTVVSLHLSPGGSVGRHPAAARQLFCVVGGEGWVAGQEGQRHILREGDAVFFERGEEHSAGTDTGFTAVVVEGDVWIQ